MKAVIIPSSQVIRIKYADQKEKEEILRAIGKISGEVKELTYTG